MNEEEIIDKLFKILTELDARNCSGNCVVEGLTGKSWVELCNEGINLFEQLK